MSGSEDMGNRSKLHLTSSDISQCLIEGPSQESQAHLENCWTCQAKLADTREPLTAFRTALVAWSAAQLPRRAGNEISISRQRGLRAWTPAAALALAAIVGLIGLGTFREHPVQRPAVAHAPAVSDSDAVLMDQVDAEVSEAVPDAMAPLTDLVAWDSGDREAAATAAQSKAGRKKPPAGTASKLGLPLANQRQD